MIKRFDQSMLRFAVSTLRSEALICGSPGTRFNLRFEEGMLRFNQSILRFAVAILRYEVFNL